MVGSLAIVIISVMMSPGRTNYSYQPKDDGETHVSNNVDPQVRWENVGELKIDKLTDDLQGFIKTQSKNNALVAKQASSNNADIKNLKETLSNLQNSIKQLANKHQKVMPSNPAQGHTTAGKGSGQSLLMPQAPGSTSLNINNAVYSGDVSGRFHTDTIHVWHYPQRPVKKAKVQKQVKNKNAGYLPISNFTAFLLHGFSAHTGADSAKQGGLTPVQMIITSNAITPNGHTYWLKGCRLIGSAHGDLSSMRVDIRLNNLECLDPQTGHWYVSEALKGYVVDSDNQVGLRAHYKNYQTARLWMAFLTGAVSGAGKAFGQAQGTTSLNPYTGGSTQIVNGSEVVRQGVGGAFSGGSDQLTKFYTEQLKMLSPVLIVNGGRVVTVNLTEGALLHWQNRHSHYIDTPPPETRTVDASGQVILEQSTASSSSRETASQRVASSLTHTKPSNNEQIAKATVNSHYATQLSGMYLNKQTLIEQQKKANSAFVNQGGNHGK